MTDVDRGIEGALGADPTDWLAWLARADRLEERGDCAGAALTRRVAGCVRAGRIEPGQLSGRGLEALRQMSAYAIRAIRVATSCRAGNEVHGDYWVRQDVGAGARNQLPFEHEPFEHDRIGPVLAGAPTTRRYGPGDGRTIDFYVHPSDVAFFISDGGEEQS